MMRLLLITLFLLAGCASPRTPTPKESAAEAKGYERGYGRAVKEQYWIIQRQQRFPSTPKP